MPIIKSTFTTPWYFQNKHLQTLLPSLTRKPSIPQRTVYEMHTNDADIMLLETVSPDAITNKHKKQNQEKAVLLIHGLTGCADSQYIVGLQNLFKSQGIFSLAMNFRGAKTPNNLARGYHSGSSHDIAELVQHIHSRYPQYQWNAIGFSLGGNVLLKYLGENPNNAFTHALAVSVPLNLDLCATQLDSGFSKIYRNHLLSALGVYLEKKHQHLKKINPQQAKLLAEAPIAKKFTSFWDFDHEIIAPIHGFESAQDYYQRCSSRQFLKHIQTPTHILNAMDDPFLSPKSIPNENELSPSVTLELSQHGGHVGFYSGNDTFYVEEFCKRNV